MSSSRNGALLPAVEARGVEKRFDLSRSRPTSLREWFIRTMLRRPVEWRHPEFRITGFDLRVEPGEAVSIIGGNGSGKSTLLRLIAGIYKPTAGTITTRGRVAAVIELGSGLHPELTGVENVRLYGTVLGMTREELQERFDWIIDFAEIGDFIHVPVKYYSSGMLARLAFSVAMASDPDILLIDEVLAVGDEAFRERCADRLGEHLTRGSTVILVSHDLDVARRYATQALWIDRGRVRMRGDPNAVVDAYIASHYVDHEAGADGPEASGSAGSPEAVPASSPQVING